MAKSDQLLEAGALLPVDAKLKDNSGVDEISARVYRHAALGESPVVRLSADNLAAGDDLTMEFLGFAKPHVAGPVAKRRRQALGFPEWALVHDPKHARYALELVKEFKKEARRARSKPGHAYEAFTDISRRLGKSVAHFLPSFWEQIGREFIVVGNATYASRAFGKAREAERVHSLKVDEKIRQDAFLEFALAGCVSAKALTEYGKELQSAHEAAAAWEFMRDLSIRRTLGGMPPWTNMCKDLQTLIKVAGLDPAEELQRVIAEIADSPAICRAPMGFWKGASKYVAKLVNTNDHVAGVLLNMIPRTSSWRSDDIWPWLDYLETWGILKNAWEEGVSAEAGPQGGPAAWFARVVEFESTPQQRLYDVLESMADRLRKDGTPLDLYKTNRWGGVRSADVDLLDLALSHKLVVAEPPAGLTFRLNDWAQNPGQDKMARDRPRDPVALAADQRFRKTFLSAVKDVAGDAGFEKAAQGKAALRETRREWLLTLLDGVPAGGLPQVEQNLDVLKGRTSTATFEEFPEALEKLTAINLLPALTRTIQAGLLDEYGWPGLETAVARFAGEFTTAMTADKTRPKPSIHGAFPYAVVCDGLNAVVVRGDEIVHEAEIQVPKGTKLERLQYFDGDVLVEVKKGYQGLMFWNRTPTVTAEGWRYHSGYVSGYVLDMPGGGTFCGTKVIHAGDKRALEMTADNEWFCDGEHFFRLIYSQTDDGQVLREVDPHSGQEGRKSMPSFFEDFITDDATLLLNRLQLVKFGDVVDSSPLGSVDGVVGFCARRHKSGRVDCEGIDGRAISTEPDGPEFFALLRQPGTDAYLPIQEQQYRFRHTSRMMVWDPTGQFAIADLKDGVGAYNRGQATGMPHTFLHGFRIRDEAASKKLRAITETQTRALADAATHDFQAHTADGAPSEGTGYPKLDRAIQKLLPKLNSDRLHVGLRAIVVRYAQKLRQLQQLIEKRDPAKIEKKETVTVTGADASVQSTMRKLHRTVSATVGIFDGIAKAAQFFAGGTDETSVSVAACDVIRHSIHHLPRKAWSLYWTQEGENDSEWLTFMEALAETGVLDLPGHFRFYSTRFKGDLPFAVPETDGEDKFDIRKTAVSHIQKQSRFLISKDYHSHQILEYSPTAGFEAFQDTMNPAKIETCGVAWNSERLREFVQLARTATRGLPAVDFIQQLAGDIGLSAAEVALIWFGYPNMRCHAANFMPKDLRTGMKLGTKDVASARGALNALADDVREGLVEELLNGPPEEFWQRPPVQMAARLKAAWLKQKPDRLELPMEMVELVSTTLRHHQDKNKLLVAMNSATDSGMFAPDTKWQWSAKDGTVDLRSDAEDPFDVGVLNAASLCIPWLSFVLPVGHPARDRMPAVHAATQKALTNANLLLAAGSGYFYDAKEENAAEKAAAAAIGKLRKVSDVSMADDGVVTVAHAGWQLHRAFRPARLKKSADYEKVQQQLDATTMREHQAACTALNGVQLIRSPGLKKICARIKKTPVPVGSYEANPLLCCPKTVAAVAGKLSVSENAAMYYLQLLALPNPTDQNLKLWNGWTAAVIKKAGAEVIESGKVLEAKRARAGRKYFVPGGWEALKAPHLPLETWKMPLYGMTRDAGHRAVPPLAWILPLEPVHQLFETAWQRVVDGDEPGYEEVS